MHRQAQQAQKDIEAHRAEQNRRKASQFGADLVALANVRYSGEIIRADEKGVLQKTNNGIVYHEGLNNKDVQQGKSYTLWIENNHYKIMQNQEIKLPDKSNEKEINTPQR